MRLIDADALKKRMVNEPVKAVQDVDFQAEWFTRIADTVCHMIDMVDDAPTIEAVPVVRCKDCKWFGGKYNDYCFRDEYNHAGDWYCADGERREG